MQIKSAKFQALFGLICAGMFTRMIPHPPNFTALVATGLFAGFYFNRIQYSIAMIFITMFLSDLMIGFHQLMPFVYLSLCIPIVLGHLSKKYSPIKGVIGASLIGSLSFFFITNFAVWAFTSLYPKTLTGLAFCFEMALPFLGNQIGGDLFYSALIFSAFFVLKNWYPALKQN